jgi:DNA-binding LytR/AlgR family response regulator
VRIAVCDDNKSVCTQICKIIDNYGYENFCELKIDTFYSGEKLLDSINKGNYYNLIYLDIDMKEINGAEVAKNIRKNSNNYITDIVFITGIENYGKELFEANALKLIDKPISENEIIDVLILSTKKNQKVSGLFKYKKNLDVYFIPTSEIIYFKKLARRIKMVSINKEDIFYMKMDDLIAEVSNQDVFIRIDRSILINFHHVRRFEYDKVEMSNGDILMISISRRESIRKFSLNNK